MKPIKLTLEHQLTLERIRRQLDAITDIETLRAYVIGLIRMQIMRQYMLKQQMLRESLGKSAEDVID